MTEGIINNVPFGVRNDEFENVGAGPADRFAGEDGLLAGVARAAGLVLRARERGTSPDQLNRAEDLLRGRVDRLFDEFEGDAKAIADVTAVRVDDLSFSYNSLHISVRNPDYVAPIFTPYERDGLVSGGSWDWTHACGTEFRDVTREDVLADPQLGTELVLHNTFQL